MKLAQFRTDYGLTTVCNMLYPVEGWVRVSESVEVEFPPRAVSDIVLEEIDWIDKCQGILQSEFNKKDAEFTQRKQELLAITYQE